MAALLFDTKGDPGMEANLKKLGVGGDMPVERRVQILQQKLAELLTALQKAGIATEI